MNPSFLFAVCQRGTENVLKQEVAREYPNFRFAYSRPGFVTFKLPEDQAWTEDAEFRCVFARTHGLSLGKVQGDTAENLAAALWQLVGERTFDHLHVWQRDAALPGEGGFEPGLTPLAEEVGQIIAQRMPAAPSGTGLPSVNRVARSGHRILDCMLVEPDQWWIGYHRAANMPSRWPGGVPKIELPDEAVSRAYLKTAEGLLWSRLPIKPGDRCVEIGSAPGGSCQALLERGLQVIGIDPAVMDPALLQHPNFTHIRARPTSLKRSEFQGIRWLTADLNVVPAKALDAVEHIVNNREVRIRGLLLTLKLADWSQADEIPAYLQRVRSWGYHYVNARQLAFDRQEICVAALRSRELRRPPAPRQRARHTGPRRQQSPEA
jgi:23S rRNA (cytidine2498-2'-O)-methyltransferase